jgi:hypothetical protein
MKGHGSTWIHTDLQSTIRVGALTARRAQRAALPAAVCPLDQEPEMKDNAAISHERLLIEPAGSRRVKAPRRLSVSKDRFVTPAAPRNLWLCLRAVFGAAFHAPGASMVHENVRDSVSGSGSQSRSFIDS